MSEYTPTWRDLREGFAGWHETDDYGYPGIPLEESRAAADRWLAAEKAKWQAEAVQEVIDFLDAQEGDGGYVHFAARLVQWWQDARAARIEKGEQA